MSSEIILVDRLVPIVTVYMNKKKLSDISFQKCHPQGLTDLLVQVSHV